jgi:hypothetical protein
MTEPDDRELEQYLKGDSPLSRRYREASHEAAPPELDAVILAQARAALKRKAGRTAGWFTGIALAASVVLGVNLGWNVYKSAPEPGEAPQLKEAAEAPAAPPPAQPERKVLQAAPAYAPDAPAEGDIAGAGAAERNEQRAAASARRDGEEARRKAEMQQQQALAVEQEPSLQKRAEAPLLREGTAGVAEDSAAPGAIAPTERLRTTASA